MKHQILDLVASGTTQQWSYTGEPSAWEACRRGSGDSSYVHTATLGHICQVTVPPGTMPIYGFVASITLHYRAKSTLQIGGAKIAAAILHNGSVLICSNYTADTTWTNETGRVVNYNDGTLHRFTAVDMADLGVQFEVTLAPASGEFRISEVWLEVDYCDAFEFYDSVMTATTPDLVPGYLAWNTAGAEAHSIGAGDILYFEDMSAVSFRRYWRTIPAYRHPTITEITLDAIVHNSGVVPASTCVVRLAQVDDGARSCWLTIVQSAGSWYLGLVSGAVDVNDIVQYRATSILTADEIGKSNYFTMVVDRNEDSAVPGTVTVAMNHIPRLTAYYHDFEASTMQQLGFGTGGPGDTAAANLDVSLNFWAWRHYQSAGPRFASWEQDVASTNTMVINSTDYAIAKPVAVPGPYLGMTVGQSNYCCELAVQDPTALCSVYQLWRFPDAVTTYDLFVDYRVTVFGQIAEVLVQRTSDFQYWDQAMGAWAVGEISSILPAAMTRQYGYAVMTNILSGVDPDGLLIRVRCIGGAPAHSVMIYKVLLQPS